MPRRLPPVYSPLPSIPQFIRSRNASDDAMDLAVRAVAARYPNYEVALFDSGTSALQMAVRVALDATDHRRPPVVAVPAWACPDLGTAVLGAGARLALFDLNTDTLEPELASVQRVLELGARAVIVPHFFGRVADIPSIIGLAAQYGAIVIEDAAQHAGGRWGGQVGGALGDLSVLSFGRGKGLNAGGGGALLRRRGATLPPLAPSPGGVVPLTLKHFTAVWATDWFSHPNRFILPYSIPWLRLGETVYHEPTSVGPISRTSLLLISWALEDEVRQLHVRRGNEAWYQQALAGFPRALLTPVRPPHESGALRVPIRLPLGATNSAAPAALRAYGVVRSYPRTLLQYEPIRVACINSHESFSGADGLASSLYTLPTHEYVTQRDRETIAEAVRVVLRKFSDTD